MRVQRQCKILLPHVVIPVILFLVVPVLPVSLGINSASGHSDLYAPCRHMEGILSVVGYGKAFSLAVGGVQKSLHRILLFIGYMPKLTAVGRL